MKKIPLTQGKFALVDDDWAWLDYFNWYLSISGRTEYARSDLRVKDKRVVLRMHRIVINAQKGQIVDHINSNGLDNRTENLRLCTNSQNFQNSRKQKNCSSKYKGVYEVKKAKRKKWRTMICSPNKGKSRHVGSYSTEIEAALAYDIMAKELFGEFARLNFPESTVDNLIVLVELRTSKNLGSQLPVRFDGNC
ncbi:hypothetical protein LCGC14_1993850 [marine sediment metagenome]|uniref:AP2/ERF domain-containing protein n=1 Tax=marine sediment metagenome TaxID=412755 RepID=A0A0F9HIN0_9ZZZZ|nr:endonuclease [Candidatus Scalindua sp.]